MENHLLSHRPRLQRIGIVQLLFCLLSGPVVYAQPQDASKGAQPPVNTEESISEALLNEAECYYALCNRLMAGALWDQTLVETNPKAQSATVTIPSPDAVTQPIGAQGNNLALLSGVVSESERPSQLKKWTEIVGVAIVIGITTTILSAALNTRGVGVAIPSEIVTQPPSDKQLQASPSP